MAKYRSRPEEIEAVKFVAGTPLPDGVVESGMGQYRLKQSKGLSLSIPIGHYIVTLPDGTRDVVHPSDFISRYEPIVEDPPFVAPEATEESV